jgi:uncharacterized protein (DUF362 family)
LGAWRASLGRNQRHTIIDFRVFVLTEISRSSRHQLDNDPTIDLPLLGFHLLMVLTLTTVQNLRSATATLQKTRACCQI